MTDRAVKTSATSPRRKPLTIIIAVLLTLTLGAGVYLLAWLASQLAVGWANRPTPPPQPTRVVPTPWPTRPRVVAATATRIAEPTRAPATPQPAEPTPVPVASNCTEALRNGGFEEGGSWDIPNTAYVAGYVNRPAAYVSNPVHSGERALRLGIPDGPDVFSYSAAGQEVTIPGDAQSAKLSFWTYSVSDDEQGDGQFVLLLKPGGGYDTLAWELANRDDWQYSEFSLDAYRGETITVHFEVHNDGDGALTAMYVDDVTLTICK